MQALMQLILDNKSLILNSFALAHVLLGAFLITVSQVLSKQDVATSSINAGSLNSGDIDAPAINARGTQIFKVVGIASVSFAAGLSTLAAIA